MNDVIYIAGVPYTIAGVPYTPAGVPYTIAGEHYTRDDVFARSDPDEFINEEERNDWLDPDEFINEEEWNAWLDMYGYNQDDYGRYEQ